MDETENKIEKCLANVRNESVKLVELLIDVVMRDHHLLQGHCSLNQYLVHRFQMNSQQAYFYSNAVRLLNKHPAFLSDLQSGQLCLSNLDLVAKRAEKEALKRNTSKAQAEKELLGEAKGKSKRKFHEHLKKRLSTLPWNCHFSPLILIYL